MKINLEIECDNPLEIAEQLTLVMSCVNQGEDGGTSFFPGSTVKWDAEIEHDPAA